MTKQIKDCTVEEICKLATAYKPSYHIKSIKIQGDMSVLVTYQDRYFCGEYVECFHSTEKVEVQKDEVY